MQTLTARRLTTSSGIASPGWLQVDVNDDLQCNYPGLAEAIAAHPDALLVIEKEV